MKSFKSFSRTFLKQAITNLLIASPKGLNIKQINWALKKQGINVDINKILKRLLKEKLILQTKNYKFKYCEKSDNSIVGDIMLNRSGHGYLSIPDYKEDIFIHKKNRLNCLNKDTVKIKLKGRRNEKTEGVVVEIIRRNTTKFIGFIQDDGVNTFFVPENPKTGSDFFIPKSERNNAEDGDRVIVEFLDWPGTTGCPFGRVLDVVKMDGGLKTEIDNTIELFDIRSGFSKEIQKEVKKLSNKISKNDCKNRVDLRNTTTFTIDPFDAKDFDDALSVKYLRGENIQIGIHIADVGHYVKSGSKTDQEAYLRAFSVYFPGRVVPMLPEKISNEICSLRPLEDKLAFSILIELDENFQINSTWMGKTIINSNKRFTYEDAEEVIKTKKGAFTKELSLLNNVSKNFRKSRMENNSIEFNRKEIGFILDKDNEPLKVKQKKILDTHKLVEEFMLMANKIVATKLSNLKSTIYRVHDLPDLEKLQEVVKYLNFCGFKIPNITSKNLPKVIRKITQQRKDQTQTIIIENLLLRAMAKAKYSTENLGHYGLGFKKYTHFTSPIRRYADLITHRLLINVLNKKSAKLKNLENNCIHFSKTERTYIEVERRICKFTQLKILKTMKKNTFEGLVSGVTKWGIFIDIEDGVGEGLITLKDLDDNCYYDEETKIIRSKNSKKIFKLGDTMTIQIKHIDLQKLELDLLPI